MCHHCHDTHCISIANRQFSGEGDPKIAYDMGNKLVNDETLTFCAMNILISILVNDTCLSSTRPYIRFECFEAMRPTVKPFYLD